MRDSALSYYSNTWDVVTWPDVEDTPLTVVASFASRTDARAFAKTRGDVVFVRPPADTLRDALAFVAYIGDYVTCGYGETRPAPPTL